MVAPLVIFCLALLLPATITRAADTTNAPTTVAPKETSTNAIGSFEWVKETISRQGTGPVIELGDKYISGNGVPQDGKKAVSLFAMAAVAGDSTAEYAMGQAFFNGIGVPRNYAKAMDWFKAAATDGNFDALGRVGALLWNGIGSTQDPDTGFRYLLRAAAAGHAPSQADVGAELQEGSRTNRDLIESLKWLQLAVDAGFKEAAPRRDEVLSLTDPAQKSEALRRAKAFKPETGAPIIFADSKPVTVTLGDYFQIPVKVFGETRYMMLDTGTSYAAFGTRFKNELGPPLSLINAETASSSESTWEQWDCPEIFIGGRRFAPLLAVTMDIGKIQQALGEPLAGILGLSSLKNGVVYFDSDNGTVTIGGPVPEPFKKNALAVPLIVKEGKNYGFDAVIDGHGPIFLTMDSGDNNSLDLSEADFRTVFPGKPPLTRIAHFMGMEGKIEDNIAFRVPTLAVGTSTCTNLLAGLSKNHEAPSRFGQRFINRYLFAADFPGRMIYLQPGKHFALPEEHDMSGLALEKIDGKVTVLFVDQDSPASAAGIAPKDQIISFNGQDVSSLKLFDIREALKSQPGNEIKMQVKHGPQTNYIQFSLKRLL